MNAEPTDYVIITDTDALTAFCQRVSNAPFITVDTEFLRESTFWAILCLAAIMFLETVRHVPEGVTGLVDLHDTEPVEVTAGTHHLRAPLRTGTTS